MSKSMTVEYTGPIYMRRIPEI